MIKGFNIKHRKILFFAFLVKIKDSEVFLHFSWNLFLNIFKDPAIFHIFIQSRHCFYGFITLFLGVISVVVITVHLFFLTCKFIITIIIFWKLFRTFLPDELINQSFQVTFLANFLLQELVYAGDFLFVTICLLILFIRNRNRALFFILGLHLGIWNSFSEV